MKTYKTTIEKPKLEIRHDDILESPREWSNLGYFITCETNYKSPDDNERLKSIIKLSGEVAKDLDDHIRLIKENFNNTDEKIIYITPVYRHEHGNIVYRRGTANGFDYSNCGFYIVTDKTQKEIGTKKKDFEKVIDSELKTYTQWVNGEVYLFGLYDDEGEIEDSCAGFYSIEDIREYLPDEWENEDLTKYIIN